MTTFVRSRRALLGLAVLAASTSAHAIDPFRWNTNQSRDFQDARAWSTEVVPGPLDQAVFAAPFTGYTVSFADYAEFGGLIVSNSAATFDVSGQYFQVNGATEIKDGANLTLRNGLMLGAADVLIGGGQAESSFTLLTEAFLSVPNVYVGSSGPGLLTVGRRAHFETGLLQGGYAGSNVGRIVVDGGVATASRTYLGGSEVCNPFCNVGVGPGKLDVVNSGSFSTGVLSLGKNGNAQVNVNSGGSLTATDITMSVLGNASITVEGGGSLNANSIVIEAAQTTVPSSGSIDVKAGGHVQLGSLQIGPAGYSSSSTISAERRLTVSGVDAQVMVTGGLAVKGGGSRMDLSQGAYVSSGNALIAGSKDVAAEVTVTSGALWQNSGAMEVGKFLQSGSRLTIDGGRVDTGSMYLAASTSCVPFCNVVPRSDLFVRNNGILNAGAFFVGRIGDAGVRVESGGQVSSAQLDAGSGFRPVEIFVTGPGSAWINAGDARLGIGGAQAAATVLLQIENGGLFKTGGALSTAALATVRLAGGTLDVGSFGTLSGVLDFQSGHLITHSDLAIQPGAPLGTNLLLESNRSLSVLGTTTIIGGQSLTINGGRFATNSLQPIGTFSFISGVFALTSDPFSVGPGGLLGSSLALTDSRRLEVTNQLSVAPSGSVNVAGDALQAGALHNEGTVQLGGGVSRITTGNLENYGRVLGAGAIQGNVDNRSEGQIRITSGQELDVSGGLKNSGQVFVLGGTLQVGGTLDNGKGAFVSGRGVLATGSVSNVGSMAFSGTTDLIGDVQNEKDGSIVISGGSTLTFYDDVVHNGAEIRASPGSSAVFFGSVKGEGKFTGGGDFFFEGDLRPGNSPAITSITGNATLGPSSLEIEIAGLMLGSQYDAVHVSGNLTLLNGTLDVLFLGGFTASAGDSFDVLDFASLSGQFAALHLPGLDNGLRWDSSQLYSTGVLSVQAVPEPGTYLLMLAGLLLLLSRGRYRLRSRQR